MIVLHSLFEEQLASEEVGVTRSIEAPEESYAEALSYFPEPDDFVLGPDEYLEQIRKIRSAVAVAVKAVMAGAAAVQMVSALLRRGPGYLKEVRDGLARWLEEHEYDSLRQMHGSLSRLRVQDPRAYERANYAKILQTWEGQTL